MKMCPSCKVELAESSAVCPLCGAKAVSDKVEFVHEADRLPASLIDPDNRADLNASERRKVTVELLSVSAFIAALSVDAVDVAVNLRFTWSPYPLASIAFVWACACVPVLLDRRPVALVLVLAVLVPAFLAALDAVDGRFTWFPAVALPLALGVELSTAAATVGTIVSRRKGLNLVAYWVFAVVAICVSIETVLDLRFGGVVSLHWANIVAYALIPIAVFLLYLHLRIARTGSLRKLFRI
ncbi:MAG: DUF6320 domain-containing protein [Spirochaetes bacterium]|nr:DUF6320 domain-containing protein [Spirochaetota bacterium]